MRVCAAAALAVVSVSSLARSQYQDGARAVRAVAWTNEFPGGLTHTVYVSPISPIEGERMEFTSVIKNGGRQPIELELTEGISVSGDLQLDAPPPVQRNVVRRLQPGEYYTQRIAGIVRSPAGKYKVLIPGPYYALEGTVEVRKR